MSPNQGPIVPAICPFTPVGPVHVCDVCNRTFTEGQVTEEGTICIECLGKAKP
jgi:hypothetical protein